MKCILKTLDDRIVTTNAPVEEAECINGHVILFGNRVFVCSFDEEYDPLYREVETIRTRQLSSSETRPASTTERSK